MSPSQGFFQKAIVAYSRRKVHARAMKPHIRTPETMRQPSDSVSNVSSAHARRRCCHHIPPLSTYGTVGWARVRQFLPPRVIPAKAGIQGARAIGKHGVSSARKSIRGGRLLYMVSQAACFPWLLCLVASVTYSCDQNRVTCSPSCKPYDYSYTSQGGSPTEAAYFRCALQAKEAIYGPAF
jgi:hypothetical protein